MITVGQMDEILERMKSHKLDQACGEKGFAAHSSYRDVEAIYLVQCLVRYGLLEAVLEEMRCQ